METVRPTRESRSKRVSQPEISHKSRLQLKQVECSASPVPLMASLPTHNLGSTPSNRSKQQRAVQQTDGMMSLRGGAVW